ncbi:hypothetical protein TRFO_06646 [Tritrichomonas foetus]|uniref:Thioredoxin domain-containing protein n=1 Tax=Tritrichomonas foetus TaxID=1144522 RepID=A0A1J4K1R7_9EUKA|nr:hypothetical protein TRFO_06646 [Tritrichomonas foetus]|eukprot:OHT03421.1 hypothetical protein TRFO_06646 [Tritrichomonas foetus]
MFLFTLFSLLFAAEESLQILSDKTFDAKVINHPANEVWIVMFMVDDANETREAMAQFRNASDISAGMVHFGVLNVRFAPKVAESLELKAYPCFRIFHGSKTQIFKGAAKSGRFLKETMKLVPDVSQNVTKEWADEFYAQPSAILFTKSATTSPLWKGISSYFAKKSVRIGICKDESLFQTFGVKEAPAIVFYNGTNTQVYDGEIKFRAVRDAIEKFFEKRFNQESQTFSDDEMLMPDQFSEVCIGGKHLCVLAATKTPPEGMAALMKGSKRKVRCFSGVVGLPFKFMERGGTWIYNPRRDGFIHVKEGEDLLTAMDRVIDGSASWTKRTVFEAPGNEEL